MTMMNNRPLSPVEVEQWLLNDLERMRKGRDVIANLEKEAKAAKREYERANKLAYQKAQGTNKDRENDAYLKSFDLLEVADDAELALKHAQSMYRYFDTEISVLRTISASVRQEYANANRGIGA